MPRVKFIRPFGCGDVVKYRGKERAWGLGDEHVICEISVRGKNNYEYSTDRGAWISHKDFEFVREADSESMHRLMKAQEEM